MKRFLYLILAALLILSATACAGQPSNTPDADITEVGSDEGGATVESSLSAEEIAALTAAHTNADGKTFVSVAVEADPGTLSPFGSGVGKVQHVIRNALFETSFCVLTDGSLAPVLATDYTQIDDVTYEINYKDYIYDSEGNHLTASDVVFSWLCGRDEWNHGNMSYIASAEAISDYTVRLTMTSAQIGTFEKVMYEGWIFTEAAYKASPDQFVTTPVGTSPYKLVSWVSGSEIILEKTGKYWETDDSKKVLIQVANVDIINYKVYSDSAQQIIGLQTGDVDMIHKVDFSNLEVLGEDYQVFSTLNNQIMTMFFNCSDDSICGDVNVRNAICKAIDANGVLAAACSGQGVVSYCFGTDGCSDVYKKWNTGDYYAYDADGAIELLKQAGYDTANPATITIMYEPTDKNAATAEFIQSYLLAINVDAKLMPVEGASYSTYKLDSTAGWDIHIGSCGGFEPYCVGPWNSNLFAKDVNNNSRNVIALEDEYFAELLSLCYASTTHTEDNMTAAYEYMTENAFVYPLYQYMLYTATSKIYTTMNLRCGGREIAPQYCNYIWND